MAPIHLDVVHSPGCIASRVLNLMLVAPRTLLASQPTGIGINAEFQSLAVDVVSQRFHSRRETLLVRDDVALGIATHLPAVIDVDVSIADGRHTSGDNCVRHFPN